MILRRHRFYPWWKISQWYSLQQEDNTPLGFACVTCGPYTGAFVGLAVCGANAGVLCVHVIFDDEYWGGRLGSRVGKGKNF